MAEWEPLLKLVELSWNDPHAMSGITIIFMLGASAAENSARIARKINSAAEFFLQCL